MFLSQRGQEPLAGLLAGVDAVGDADAAEVIAGKLEGGQLRGEFFDFSNAFEVAEGVLRHRLAPAFDVRRDGRRCDVNEFGEITDTPPEKNIPGLE